MKITVRNEIKQNLKHSLYSYVSRFRYSHTQPIDYLLPTERKIRSVIGGLETSMGTRVWEPIAKTLAVMNDFELVEEKILRPHPFPEKLAHELSVVITLRENQSTWISSRECVERFRSICKKVNQSTLQFVTPAAGTGVDLAIRKIKRESFYDLKTVQPNLGSIKSFNKQLLEWYAYRLCKNPDADVECKIAYPYNPYADSFWSHTPHTKKILEPGVDAVVESEFWDVLSGEKNTYQEIINIFIELRDEGFGEKLSHMIRKLHILKT